MKIRLLCVLALSALSLAACTSKEDQPVAYKEFRINNIKFTSNGAKTAWSSEGHFFWRNSDGLYVNGVRYVMDNSTGDCWYAVRADGGDPVKKVNNKFYLAYYGYGSNDVSLKFIENQGVYYPEYEEEDWYNGVSSYVPLAACVSDNNVTLTPCCAILRVQVATSGYLDIFNADGDQMGPFVMHGSIDPVTARFVDINSYLYASLPFAPGEGNNTCYFVLPMENDEETIAGMVFHFDDGSSDVGTTASSITIRKGYIYDINLMAQ